ncbi:MAG TPA: hypothetical protein PLA90_05835, partial [Candidatus Sumerlaeota bacterium]|nr:hypothetical protein [Candidatus Sumerlaeota bacterium]
MVALAPRRTAQELIGDLSSLDAVRRQDFEAVGVEMVGVSTAVLAAVGPVRVHEVPGKLDRLEKRLEERLVVVFLVEFREKSDGTGVVPRIGAFVLLEPPLLWVLPGERQGGAILGHPAVLVVAGDLIDVVGSQRGKRLMVCQAPGFVVEGQMVAPFTEKLDQAVV